MCCFHQHVDDVAPRDVTVVTAAKAKMADLSGTQLLEKRAETELKKRQKRSWSDLHMSGKIGITTELPETLGFYDINAVRREQQEQQSAGNVKAPLLTLITSQLINRFHKCISFCFMPVYVKLIFIVVT